MLEKEAFMCDNIGDNLLLQLLMMGELDNGKKNKEEEENANEQFSKEACKER